MKAKNDTIGSMNQEKLNEKKQGFSKKMQNTSPDYMKNTLKKRIEFT